MLSDYVYSVIADSKGDVYVADSGNQRIVKYTHDGQYILEWGSDGPDDGQFSIPMAIAISEKDDVYVADPGYNRIQRFTINGSYLGQWQVGEDPVGIAADSEGNILVIDQ